MYKFLVSDEIVNLDKFAGNVVCGCILSFNNSVGLDDNDEMVVICLDPIGIGVVV